MKRNRKDSFWKKYGHHFILVGFGVAVVLIGYGVGRLVFKTENPVNIPEAPVETPVETPVDLPLETPVESPVEQPDELDNKDIIAKTETKKEPINYEYKEIKDDTLLEGETKVVQKGVLGEKVYMYQVTYQNGQEIKRHLFLEEISIEPVTHIVHVGTKKAPETTTELIEKKISIPYATVYEEDDTQYVGYLQKKTSGVQGEKVQKIKITYVNGVEKSREVISEEITKKAVNEVFISGTKPLDGDSNENNAETPVG